MNSETQITNAKNIYVWLWLSPILLFISEPFAMNLASSLNEKGNLPTILYSALLMLPGTLHLWLLIPSIIAKSEFVRWHARQAFALAALRTMVVPSMFLFISPSRVESHRVLDAIGFSAPILILIWLVGNLWGGAQVNRGDCALMRWAGRGANLPVPVATSSERAPSDRISKLVEIVRYSRDETERRMAVNELTIRGAVEEL